MSKRSKLFYEFGPFRLDTTERVLLRDGTPVPLTPKAFELLHVLVDNSGHIVEKDELLEKVWPDAMVEEGSINRNVSTLRKALREDASEQQYIETVPKRGYRFIAPVREFDEQPAGPIVEGHTSPRLGVEEEIIRSIETDPPFLKAALYANRGETTRVRSRPALLIVGFFILAASVAVTIHFVSSNRPNEPAPASAFKTTAVLPFKLIGEENGDEYLKLGMADVLITKLSNLRQISVRPTSAIRKYVATGQDAVTAAQDLGVESILDGNIQRLGDRIRVTVQLINAHDGLPLWADKFDASFTDIFEVEDSISEQIVKALALGAQAVMIGRATLYGLAAGGEPGVERALGILSGEIHRVLGQLGCNSIAELSPQHVRTRVIGLQVDARGAIRVAAAPGATAYEVLWRRTTDSEFPEENVSRVTATKADLNQSKYNVIFGVRSIDAKGHRSLVVIPEPERAPTPAPE